MCIEEVMDDLIELAKQVRAEFAKIHALMAQIMSEDREILKELAK